MILPALFACMGQSCDVLPLPAQVAGFDPMDLKAVIAADQVVFAGAEVILDGSGSKGSQEKTYLWTQVEGPSVALIDATTPIARFTAPYVEADVLLVFQLTVSRRNRSVSQTTTVQVLPAPVPVDIGILASTVEGDAPLSVDFQAYAVDIPAGWLLEGLYVWDWGDGNAAEGSQVTHVFSTPGTYIVTLCATLAGGFVSTGCSERTITANKPAVETSPGLLTISGFVRNGGSGVGSAVVAASSGSSTAVTDASGFYQIVVPWGWSGQVAPQHLGYTFEPPSHTYTNLSASLTDQDFEAAPLAVPTLSPTASSGSVTTNAGMMINILLSGSGQEGQELTFSIDTHPAHGSLGPITNQSPGTASVAYTPMAGHAGIDSFSFRVYDGVQFSDAATISITINSTDAVMISGQIVDHAGSPRAGVGLVFTGTGASGGSTLSTMSGTDGRYAVSLPGGWSGTVTADENARLDPPFRAYASLQTSPASHNYTAFRNYYVATSGSDTAAGTITAPLKTPQKAADRTDPGDTVYFREGTYKPTATSASAAVLRVTRDGQPGRPITFKAYPGETVVLTGEGTRYDALAISVRPSDQHPSSGKGVQHIVIEGLIIDGGTKHGIGIYGPVNLDPPTAHITVRRCIARRNNGIGIGTRGKVNNVIIERCEAYENHETGIVFGRLSKNYHDGEPETDMNAASYSTIRHCLAYNNAHPSTPGNTDGIGFSHTYRCKIEDNVVFGNSDDGIDIYASLEATISRNLVFGHRHPQGNGAGIKVSAGGGGKHLLVRNVSFDNKSYGLESSKPSLTLLTYRASTFYHNLAYRTGSPAISIGDGTAQGTWVLHNNIAVEASGSTDFRIWSASNTTSDHNLWRQSDLTQSQSAGRDMNSLTGDPGFVNPGTSINTTFGSGWTIDQKLEHIRAQVKARFSLNSSSRCRDAGKNVGLDYEGSAPDIGPYEYE